MELKEGMYVRTKWSIFKFLKIDEEGIYRRTFSSDNEDITTGFEIEDVIKASYNIIDLIEEGDFIDHLEVMAIQGDYIVFREATFLKNGLKHYGIKSIVTKEQFENMQYRLGD